MEAMMEEDQPLGLGSCLNGFVDAKEVSSMMDEVLEEKETEAQLQKFKTILSRYQEQPHLIDPFLEGYFSKLNSYILDGSPLAKRWAASLSVVLIKVRGPKKIHKFMPHDSLLLVKALKNLEALSESDPWELHYVLLLMMSMLVLVPFQMEVLLHTQKETSLSERIYRSILPYLDTTSATQDAAVLLIAKFATRSDTVQHYLPSIIEYCTSKTLNVKGSDFSSLTSGIGGLKTLCSIYKYSGKPELIPYAQMIFDAIKNLSTNDNTLIRKYYLKLVQRLALNFLPSKKASWRRQRVAKTLLNSNSYTLDKEDEKEEEDFIITEDESVILESVVQDLLDGLKDKDTAVRWSAAKGIGRITNHIPLEFCDDIISSLVSLFSFRETDNAWHGGCLALAELARRGLILDSRLNDVMSVVTVALLYDERKGCYSVGSHVRDAACYVCWSFSRSYTKETLGPYTSDFANALLSVMLFDREITCRRAASATFQEIVGRQDLFAHGLEILPMTDYYAVGNRAHTFLSLSVSISKYPQYTSPLFKHVLSLKTTHWDINIRELASQTLKNLTLYPSNRDYAIKQGLNDLFSQVLKSDDARVVHGGALGFMDIISGIVTNHGLSYVEPFMDSIKKLSLHLSEKMQQSSLGRELVHLALLNLIKNASLSSIPFHNDDIIDLWQSIIDDGIPSTDVKVREFAIETIHSFCNEYFIDINSKKIREKKRDLLISKYVQNLEPSFNMREGFSLALGSLPFETLHGKFDVVVRALCKSSQIKNGTEMWAESRRNAIQGICQIFSTMEHHSEYKEFTSLIPEIFEVFIAGLNDYTIERRGDIGAWVREASISGLYTATSYCQKIHFDVSQFVRKFSPLIARQAVEKIDRTRSLAAKTFVKFVRNEYASRSMPENDQVSMIFHSIPEDFAWSSESETFPLFTKLIKVKSYGYELIKGLIVSIGGVSFGLVKHATSSLFAELAEADEDFLSSFLSDVIDILKVNSGNERIVSPYFGFIKHLVEAGSIENFLKKVASNLFTAMNKEITNCKDPKKILSFIDAICSLFQIENSECQALIYKKMVNYLFHRYPRIRKLSSCKMYETLTIADTDIISESNLNSVLSLLNEKSWDSTDMEELKPLKKVLLSYLEESSSIDNNAQKI